MVLYCKERGTGFGEIVDFFRKKGIKIKVTSSKSERGAEGDKVPIILERILEMPSIYQNQLSFDGPFEITDKGWLYISAFRQDSKKVPDSLIERTYIKFIREPF